jgi:hypothetical protein
MARKNRVEEKIDLEGLPKETIAAVVIAQMYQVQAIADTLPNASDKHLLYVASNVVLDLLKGYTSPEVVAAVPQIQAILSA